MNTILTNIGEQLASNGFITGVMPKISKVWFGDGGGSIITPTKDTTQLVNKITEGVGTTILRLGEPNRLYIYTQIPNNIGDFTVREIGLLTEDDILIAYGGGFEQYKPPLNVSSDRFDYYITIPLSSTQDITINFTNDNEYAPQESVDLIQNGLEARRLEIVDINNRMPNKVEYSDIVDNVVTSDNNKPLSAKQGKILKDLVDTKQNIIQDNTLAINKLNISGGTEINAALVDGDTFIVDDGNNNTVRKSLISRLWTYINSKLTGAISTVVTSNLTASRVVVSDSAGKIGVSGVTATELGYLSGTSSSVQTQLNGKAATNQTMYIGTTAVTINRASASLALTGISIDGNAATVTNGVYTTGDQTIAGVKTFSSTIDGNISGNSATATKLATARTITLSGGVSGNTSFDGSGNVTLVATVANDSHTHAFTNLTNKPTTLQGYGINPEELPADINLDTKTITGLYSQSQNAKATLTLNYPVALAGLLEVFAYSSMIHQRYWAYNSDDVYYRAKYNTGAWTPWTKGANVDDTVAAATKLATARTINGTSFDGTASITTATWGTARTLSYTGDVTGSASVNGSANIATVMTLANSGVTAGTYKSITVDEKGRVIAGTNPTTLSGYGITDATPSSHIGSTGVAHGVATTSVDGFMSSTDKTKLNGIAAGAQVNVATNLGSSGTGATRTITSSTGSSTSITYSAADVGAAAVNDTVNLTGEQTVAGKKNFSDIIVGRIPAVVTSLSSLTPSTPSIYTNDVTVSNTGTQYVPMIHGTSIIGGVGYRQHVSIGHKRTPGGWGSFYIAVGGNDSYPTREWLFYGDTGNLVSPGTITAPTFSGALSGNASTATALQTARTIGGVSFDGTANITLPGVNAAGNQNTTGNAGSATKLATARTIALSGGATGTATSFDGTGNISIPVTGLDASNLSSGTVPDARLSGVYSGMSLKLNGNNTVFTTESSGSANISRTVYGLTDYKNDSASTTGAIVFIAPSSPSAIMHQLEVSGLLYNQNIVSLIVQGYRTTGAWSDLRKISTGTVDIQVRWGVTPDGKNCLILGDVGTVWSYPHISITRAMFSYTGINDTYCTGWTVALVTSFTGYSNISATIDDSTMIGNAGSATKLATARLIGGVSFDGTANITLPGVNATGNQDTTGNAGSATKLNTDRFNYKGVTDSVVVGELMWKNYGNGHTIFDASNSTTPTGVAKNNTNPDYSWSVGNPTLMGYNGNNTFGVRVDYSRYADQLKTPRTIGGVSFDGSANINLPGVNITGNQNTTGNAATATTAANANQLIGKNWYWSGQGGQPTWLWGGSDGTNMYVYNPSNFVCYRVNDLWNHQWDNKTTNGYIRLSTGLIIQWGVSTTSVNDGTSLNINFNIAFPNECFVANCTPKANTANVYGPSMSVINKTTTYFTVYNSDNNTSKGQEWMAIGY